MSDHQKIWGHFEESFGPRRWDAIRTSWPAVMGKQIAPPGSAPAKTLSDFLNEGGIFLEIPAKGKLTETIHPRGEIPEFVFHEAIFWLHKALHVLGASEIHVDVGLPTWSLSSAYQNSYFAARSIMAFFGVTVAELRRVSIAVDLCRNMQGIRPQRMSELGAFEENIALRSIGVLFDHRQIWILFQRLLRSSTCSVWPDGWLDYFAHLDIGDITKQRHGLHYQLPYWVANDLHEFVYSDDFYDITPTGTGRTLFDSEKQNFSLALGAAMTRMGLLLFKDLCGLTNRLADERLAVLNAFSPERHPLFADELRREIEV